MQIGAVNTLVRQEDCSLKGYNTDWSAAIAAIERGLDPGGAGVDRLHALLRLIKWANVRHCELHYMPVASKADVHCTEPSTPPSPTHPCSRA